MGVAMMFFCVGVQVLAIGGIWILLWRRNRERHAVIKEREGDEGEELEMCLRDITDLQNEHFRVRLKTSLLFGPAEC